MNGSMPMFFASTPDRMPGTSSTHRYLLSVLLLLSLAVVGCSSTPKDKTAAKKSTSGTDEQIFIGDSFGTEKNYDPHVIMKRGEAYFEREDYAEALVEFTHFLELHKTHVLAPYAAFRIGETHFKMAKSVDRDPEPMQKAITALEKMRRDYAGSRYDQQAQQKIQECHEWLAQTYLLVGQFYYRRESYLAAAHRFEQIMKVYPDKPVAPEALYYLALSYHQLGADDWAKQDLILLAQKYPRSKTTSEGRSLLAKLGGAEPSTMVATEAAPSLFSDTPDIAGQEGTGPLVAPSTSNTLTAPKLPSASALVPAFVPCRLGAWC